jgi:hypothetical protein
MGGWNKLPTIQIFSLMLVERGYTKVDRHGRSVRQGIRLKTSGAALTRPAQTVSTQTNRPRQARLGPTV